MRRIFGIVLTAAGLLYLGSALHADEQEAKSVLDKALKALGGEERLAKAGAITWKAKGKIRFGDNENDYTIQVTAQGVERIRSEFEGEFNGNKFRAAAVIHG